MAERTRNDIWVNWLYGFLLLCTINRWKGRRIKIISVTTEPSLPIGSRTDSVTPTSQEPRVVTKCTVHLTHVVREKGRSIRNLYFKYGTQAFKERAFFLPYKFKCQVDALKRLFDSIKQEVQFVRRMQDQYNVLLKTGVILTL